MADRPLPDGWYFDSLIHDGVRTSATMRTPDRYIDTADVIVVVHRAPDGTETYRTIHGAESKRAVGLIIDTVIDEKSPV